MKTSKFADDAAKMAERMDRAAAVGEQLTFLADPDGESGQVVAEAPKPGRPKGSKNKVESQLRAMIAAKGMRMPEDVLTEIAGLSSREDVLLTAMSRAERVLDWAESGAAKVGKGGTKTWEPSGAQRLAVFFDIYRAQIKALEALLPYGLAKVTPDATTNIQSTTIVMPGGGDGANAQVINGSAKGRITPPPLPQNVEQNQEVSSGDYSSADSEDRTK